MTDKFIRKYMLIAKTLAEHDVPCLSRGIGSVIVDTDQNIIIGTGYNGSVRGLPDQDSKEFLKEYVYPQLTEHDKKYLNNASEDHCSSAEIFSNTFSGCKICPRKLIGCKSGERLDLCSCLSYESRIQVDNGKWVKIGDLVRNKYQGYVKSLNINTKQIENQKVIGWYEIPFLEKKLYTILTKYNRMTRQGYTSAKFTRDHLILTENGYKRVDSLNCLDRIAISDQALSNNQLQIVLGSLLGDASISNTPGSARFRVSHCQKQKEYLEFKQNILSSIIKEVTKTERDKITPNGRFYPNHIMYSIVSKCSQELKYWKEICYDQYGKTIDFVWLNQIDWLGLACWYMDDGSKITPKTGYISCYKFNKEKLETAQIWLKSKFNISTTIDYKYKRILINTESFAHLCNNIYKYIPKCMRYKLTKEYQEKEYELELPQDSARIFYDQLIKVEEVNIEKSKIRSKVYCLDVENNNNFLTLNSIVHNCSHAERNAIFNCSKRPFNATMFAYCGLPCLDCTVAIIQSGIKTIYCLDESVNTKDNTYELWRSQWMFDRVGIIVRRVSKEWILQGVDDDSTKNL